MDIQTFWQNLSPSGKIFFCMALPATIILVIHTILTLLGLDHGSDFDGTDVGSDYESEHDPGVSFFTIRNFEAFFSMCGWGGLLALERGMSNTSAILIGAVLGFASTIMMIIFMRALYNLQTSGTYDLSSVIGKKATVYINIPQANFGFGKINVEMGGIVRERKAISKGEAIKEGTQVKIVDRTGNFFIVERSI